MYSVVRTVREIKGRLKLRSVSRDASLAFPGTTAVEAVNVTSE